MKTEGWWWPENSGKRHYMRAGRSLCGRWGCIGNPQITEVDDNSDQNCQACKKKLAKNPAKEEINDGTLVKD